MKKTKLIAVMLIWFGVIIAAGLGLLIFEGSAGSDTVSGKALLVGLGVVAVLMIAIGLNLLLAIGQSVAGEPRPRASYRHSFRLFGIIGLLVVIAFVVRQLLVPPSFGQQGSYRGAAVEEARVHAPRHIDEAICGECHKKQAHLHGKDAHASVQCGTCHGPGWRHAKEPETEKVKIPDGKDECLVCHRRLDARPGWFPQIRVHEHFLLVGVKDESISCLSCHDPHEPLFMDRDKRSARLHPLVHRCRDCHTGRVSDYLPKPDRHPVIFECDYCHKETTESFASGAHHKIRCTTCHLFSKETAYAGRIIRDTDPRFCLLCHRDADFRSSSAPPGIDWPDHLEDVQSGPEDAEKLCVDCHRDRIHPPPVKQGGGSEQ
jgi:flagellar biogenesis protein FliO